MKCPYCHSKVRVGAAYCGACGNKLGNPCPSCGFANRPHVAFCGRCGARLQTKTGSRRRWQIALGGVFLALLALGLVWVAYPKTDGAGRLKQASQRFLEQPTPRIIEKEVAVPPGPERPGQTQSESRTPATEDVEETTKVGISAILSIMTSSRYEDPSQRIQALDQLKTEMGADLFGHALINTPTDVLLTAIQQMENEATAMHISPNNLAAWTQYGARNTWALQLGVVGLHALQMPANTALASTKSVQYDAAGLWILSQKAIALAQQGAGSEEGKRLAIAAYQGELSEELFDIVIRNVPVTDPQTSQVFTLEEYAERTYLQAGAALEDRAADLVDVEAVHTVVDFLDRHEVPWEDVLIASAHGQSPGEVLGPWVVDRALTWATEQATAELGLTDRDVTMIVAASKVAIGVKTANPLLVGRASIELAALVREDLESGDSRLRPVADWALSNPTVREAYDRFSVGQYLSEAEFDLLRKGMGDIQLWLDGSPDAWLASAEDALLALGAEKVHEWDRWMSLTEEDLGAVFDLVDGFDLGDASVDRHISDLLDGVSLGDVELPDWALDDLELPDLGIDDIELPDLGVDDLELPDLGVDDIELPDLGVDDIKLPDLGIDDIELPDWGIGDIELPDWNW
jgi:hypothetical protein